MDSVIYLDGLAFLVESKHWKDKVPFGPVASMFARLRRRPPSTMGLVVGAVGFTDPARELLLMMGDNRVLLWNGDEVSWAVQKPGRFAAGLRLKYRQAVERALPDFSLLVGVP